jgi:hypothetical protein
MVYDHADANQVAPSQIVSVYRRKNILIINNELFELNKPGFCRDSEDEHGKLKTCIIEVLPVLTLSPSLSVDSVYVFEKNWYQPDRVDSTIMRFYISTTLNLLVKKEKINNQGTILTQDELVELKKK